MPLARPVDITTLPVANVSSNASITHQPCVVSLRSSINMASARLIIFISAGGFDGLGDWLSYRCSGVLLDERHFSMATQCAIDLHLILFSASRMLATMMKLSMLWPLRRSWYSRWPGHGDFITCWAFYFELDSSADIGWLFCSLYFIATFLLYLILLWAFYAAHFNGGY